MILSHLLCLIQRQSFSNRRMGCSTFGGKVSRLKTVEKMGNLSHTFVSQCLTSNYLDLLRADWHVHVHRTVCNSTNNTKWSYEDGGYWKPSISVWHLGKLFKLPTTIDKIPCLFWPCKAATATPSPRHFWAHYSLSDVSRMLCFYHHSCALTVFLARNPLPQNLAGTSYSPCRASSGCSSIFLLLIAKSGFALCDLMNAESVW